METCSSDAVVQRVTGRELRPLSNIRYKLMLDRMVGNRHLHSKVAIVAAGNLETDNAIVEEMSTALQSRLVHYQLVSPADEWLEWAMRNGIHHYVTSFIKWKPAALNNFNPNSESPDKTYACQRTWEFASRFLYQRELTDPLLLVNLAGVIGEGMAREFLGYCRIYGDLPSREEIVKQPLLTRVPEERSILWALTGSIASWVTEHSLEPLMKYLGRFPKEFQTICLREMVRRNPATATQAPVLDWLTHNAVELW